eukprot:m.47662 g.47662  ORF g.47662 m.47662 type:complete len:419 (-) comp7348_c0_seq1:219-1475(-)
MMPLCFPLLGFQLVFVFAGVLCTLHCYDIVATCVATSHCVAGNNMQYIVGDGGFKDENVRDAALFQGCICVEGYDCQLFHSPEFSVPCGAGIVKRTHDGVLLEKVPARCEDCQCIEAPGQGEGDRVVMEVSRIILSSVPRSGNGWMRKLLELSTGVGTETVFHEKFTVEDEFGNGREVKSAVYRKRTGLFAPDCGLINDCDRVKMSEGRGVIVKSHFPFIPSHEVQNLEMGNASDVGVGVFHILPIRNPLDNFDAWNRYLQQYNKEMMNLTRFLDEWTRHHVFWQEKLPYSLVQKYVYRFEDMNDEDKRKKILNTLMLKGNLAWLLDTRDVDANFGLNDKRLQMRKNGHVDQLTLVDGYMRYTEEEITLAITKTKPLLQRYGYYHLYIHWLKMRREYDKFLQEAQNEFKPNGYQLNIQ